MDLAKSRPLSMSFAVAVVLAVGLGPAVASDLQDLITARTTLAAGLAAVAAMFVIGMAMSLLAIYLGSGVPVPVSRRVYAKSIGTGLVLAALSLFFSAIDGENSTAWRNANWLNPSDGVESRRLDEYGNHFGRLVTNAGGAGNEWLAELPVPIRVLLVGGEYRTLVRINAAGGTSPPDLCRAQAVLVIRAADDAGARTIESADGQDLCGKWARIDLRVPAGVTTLRIAAPDLKIPSFASIDWMIVEVRPAFAWLWAAVTFVGAAIFFGLLFRLAQALRQDGRPVSHPVRGGPSSRQLPSLLALLLFLCAGNLFVYSFVAEEQTIYTWDNAGYWRSAIGVSQFLQGSERKSVIEQNKDRSRRIDDAGAAGQPGVVLPKPGPVAALIRNIRFTEYNVTTSLPIAPVMALLGESRMVYELSLLNVYAVAAMIMLILAIRASGYAVERPWPTWWPFVPVVVALCFVPFWVPLIRGYMGISTVAPNLAILWLYFRRPPEQARDGALLAMGLLLVAGVLLQRWNAFWVISFFVLAATDSLYSLWRRREYTIPAILQSFRVPAFAGLIALCAFAVLAWPKIVTIVTTDYADIYSAYLEHSSLLSAALKFVGDAGLLLFIFVIASFLYLLSVRSTRRTAALLAVQVVVVFVHMSSTQTMGPHHLYVLMPALLMVLCLAFIQFVSSSQHLRKPVSIALAGIYTVVGIFSMASVFTPSAADAVDTTTIRLLSNDYRPPLVRGDLGEFDRLAMFLDRQLEGTPDSAGVYVLAGSQVLNPEHLQNIGPSLGREFDVQDRLLRASIVDKRDGFPGELLDAALVVTSDPVQLSRRPEDQQVIQIPARQLEQNTGIGPAFERLRQVFYLDNGVEVSVFRRIRENTSAEIASLSDELRAVYPDRPDVYER